MRVSEIAKLLHISSKEFIAALEEMRAELEGKGLLVPSPVKASNTLEEDTACEAMAIFDRRKLESKKAQEEQEEQQRREEHEQALRLEQERLRQQEEERRRQEEEQRRLADLELQKKRQELEAQHAAAAAKAAAAAPLTPATAPPGLAAAGEESMKSAVAPPNAPPRRKKGERPERGKPAEATAMQILEQGGTIQLEGLTHVSDSKPRGRKRGEKPASEEQSAENRRRRPVKGAPAEVGGRKGVRPSRLITLDDVPAIPGTRPRQKGGRGGDSGRSSPQTPVVEKPKKIRLEGDFTLGEFAARTGVSLADYMRQLLMMGEAVTINQLLNPDLAEMLAAEVGIEVEIVREDDLLDVQDLLAEDPPESLRPRPPVVTVMGHVDHGKTTLLDRIRKTRVAEGEAGGITQHIGAYTVTTEKGRITFLDTPGHEAFTSMRARGANMTDIVVLVVAANDGVMPQTVEAINHARAAKAPIVVAINKIDVPGADPLRVKQDLMKYDLVPEEFGGSTITAEISAKQGLGIENLLDLILLQSEVLELKANPEREATGVVVESHMDPQRGAMATLLVQRGTLRLGDLLLAGPVYGRVRAMSDDAGKPASEAGPCTPVAVLGLPEPPPAGELFVVMRNEQKARQIAENRQARHRRRAMTERQQLTLESLTQRIEEGRVKELPLILKGDVQGSVEALTQAILKIASTKVSPKLIHTGVGAIGSSDVDLASASGAIILGFNVTADAATRELAEREGVQIKIYQVIYTLLDDLRMAMLGMLETRYEQVVQGRAVVRAVFRSGKFGSVAGCFVESGTIERAQRTRIMRNGREITQSVISSLRRVRDDVKSVQSGLECGIGIENYDGWEEGDIIETYILVEQAKTLE